MAEPDYQLSTVDNPWNPWTQFDEWYAYDIAAGHHTLAYLARVTITSDDLSQAEQDLDVKRAIDEIIRIHDGGIYITVDEPK